MADTSAYLEQLIAWRRHLHQYPEASFEEVQTVAYIRDELAARVPGAMMRQLTATSLVVELDTGRPGPRIGLRADIDGLVMQEDRPDLEFASKVPNRMHGCGHDAHAATMMAALAWAWDHRDELSGTIVGIFQHAEETPPGGAKEMVATGFFEDFDHIFGFHYWATLPVGTVDVKDGPASANSDLWEVTLDGKGAHASMPELSSDAVLATSTLVQQLLQIPARRVHGLEPAVVTCTWLEAGTQQALNVIPPRSRVGGVVRTHSDEVRAVVRRSFDEILAGLEAANPGLTCTLDYLVGYDMVWNDPGCTAVVRELAQARWGDQVVSEAAMLGGEDFAAFSRVAPSTYVFIGAGNPDKGFSSSHHSPTFGLDEDAFPVALQLTIDVIRHANDLAEAGRKP